jgi:VWFA-related protein
MTNTLRSTVLTAAAFAVVLHGQQQAPPDQQRPVFRTGTSLVRVDAYPSKDGKILEGLTAEDFEVLEDGVPQKIASFQFVEYQRNTPSGERRDPNSQREAFQLAADPTYRVFILYLDNLHVDFKGSHASRVPLITFMQQVLGPKDLFGVLTTHHSINDLILGQKTEFIEEQLTKYWDWGTGARVLQDDEDLFIASCFPKGSGDLIYRRGLDAVFSGLEGLISAFATMREERKNILLVSDGWVLPGIGARPPDARPVMPTPGVTNAGKITLGRTGKGDFDPRVCEELMQRLMGIDFRQRFAELLRLARQSNVTFYTLKPSGLTARMDRADRDQTDSLMSLASETDGIAVVNTNDLTGGARRIGDDLSASYILGYYPTNTKADGRVRKITVRLKGSKGTVRARREYRAPTEEEMASMRAAVAAAPAAPAPPSGVDMALAELKRLRPSAVLHTRGTILGDELLITTELTAPEVEAGRWKSGGDLQIMVSGPTNEVMTTARGRLEPGARAAVVRIPLNKADGPFSASVRMRNPTEGSTEDGVTVARRTGLLGDPLIYRLTTPTNARPAASVEFRRTERIQIRWPVLGTVQSREGRILGRDGVPLELLPKMSELDDARARYLVADLNLAPLTAGEYIIEVTATGAGKSESGHLAIRVGR